ncbi:MAG: SH3 domain-containing protein [Clostridia bacterium]
MKKIALKRLVALALVITTILCVAAPAMAIEANQYSVIEPFDAVTNTVVWLRQTAIPDAGTNKIMDVPKGSPVSVLGKNGNTWYYINYNGTTGFAYQKDISTDSGSTPSVPDNNYSDPSGYTSVTQFEGVTNAVVWLRKTANKDAGANKIMDVPKGSTITVIGESGPVWYVINYRGTEGFAYKKDIDRSSGAGTTPDSSAPITNYTGIDPFEGITNSLVYLRKTASKDVGSNKIMNVLKGSAVTVIGESGSTWYVINYNGTEGFAYKKDINRSSGGNSGAGNAMGNYTSIAEFQGTTNATVWLRYTANKEAGSNKIMDIAKGNVVTVIGESGATWYYIRYNGTEGFAYKKDISTPGASGGAGSGAGSGTGSNPSGDNWGHISVAGTNIDKDIMSNRVSGGSYVYNAISGSNSYVYSLTNYSGQPAVIMGHNMRVSKTGFHALHHVQNAFLGVGSCERCGASCSGARTSVFDIDFNGSTQWEVVCFYETPTGTSSSVKNLAACATATSVDRWLSTQLSNANKSGWKGEVLSNASASDKLMILITCGDKASNSKGAGLYFVLKAIN